MKFSKARMIRKNRATLGRTTLSFKYTASRGQDTYGYNICSLYVHEVKVASCNGGGYDMQGTVLADWILNEFPDQLKRLTASEFEGLNFSKRTAKGVYVPLKKYRKGANIYLNGACGFSSIEAIANALGLNMQYVAGKGNITHYTIESV